MSWTYAIVVWDTRSTPGVRRAQDLVAIKGVDRVGSVFNATTNPKPTPSTLKLTFPADTPDLNIHEGAEVWEGWRDSSSGQWHPTLRCFGGYIAKLSETVEAGQKQFTCELTDYAWLLTKQNIKGWPTSELNVPAPGFPPDFSVADWLVNGGAGFTGLLPQALPNFVRFDGIDPIFADIRFTNNIMPGITEPGPTGGQVGRFGFQLLDKVVSAIVSSAHIAWARAGNSSPLRAGYWMRAVPNGTEIVPQFNLRNMLDPANAYCTVTDIIPTPAGQYLVQLPYSHERDMRDVVGRVLIKGRGVDLSEPGAPLVYGEYADPDHVAQYPCRYFSADYDGWKADPQDEPRLHTRAFAQEIAATVESQTWGALGIFHFQLEISVPIGDGIRFISENEAIDTVFPCTSCEEVAGDRGLTHAITMGFTPITLADLMQGGGLPDQLLQQQDYRFEAGTLFGQTDVSQVRKIPVELAPNHAERNTIQPMWNDTPGMQFQASPTVRPDGTPVPVNLDPAPQTVWRDQYGNVMDYHTAPGVSPARMPFSFAAAGSVDWVSDETGAFLRAVVSPSTATFTLTRNGSTVANPPIYAQTGSSGDPLTLMSAGDSVPYAEGDDLVITVTGAARVTLSHRATQVVPS